MTETFGFTTNQNNPRRIKTVGGWDVEVPAGEHADAAIARIATGQRGLATRQQLLGAGVSPQQIKVRLRRRQLRTVHRGLYTTAQGGQPDLFRETAALLVGGNSAVISHLSALGLWRLRPAATQHDEDCIDVTLAAGDRARSRPGIRIHRCPHLSHGQVRRIHGLPTTAPERTLLDSAPLLTSRELERAVDEALARRITTTAKVIATVAASRGHPGMAALRHLIAARNGTRPTLTESEAEERFLALLRSARLPAPVLQATLYGYRVDAYWPEAKLAVEIDGFQWHSSKTSFERDRRKDRVMADHGIEVCRVTRDQVLNEPLEVVTHLARRRILRSETLKPRAPDPTGTGSADASGWPASPRALQAR